MSLSLRTLVIVLECIGAVDESDTLLERAIEIAAPAVLYSISSFSTKVLGMIRIATASTMVMTKVHEAVVKSIQEPKLGPPCCWMEE